MFNENDYITIVKDSSSNNNWENFVVKQLEDNNNIIPIITPLNRNNSDRAEIYSHFNETYITWRYSTPEEIEEYDRIGKPFNVTTFQPFILPKNWHIFITEENAEDVLTWRFDKTYTNENKITFKNHFVGVTLNNKGTKYEKGHNPKDSIKDPNGYYDFGIEITFEQFKKHVLNKEFHIEDYSYLIEFFKKHKIK